MAKILDVLARIGDLLVKVGVYLLALAGRRSFPGSAVGELERTEAKLDRAQEAQAAQINAAADAAVEKVEADHALALEQAQKAASDRAVDLRNDPAALAAALKRKARAND